ncbi:MAG: hypothetical protein ACR2GJ_06205 [Gemmatimonadaceae bacterium]
MAELHIERKDSNIWPWIIGGLILLAVILWFIFGVADERETTGLADTAVVVTPAAVAVDEGTPAAVTAFLQYADSQTAANDPGLAHGYTSTGMQRLVAAFDAMLERETVSSVEVAPRLVAMRALADSMQMNPQSMEHARHAREAFMIAAGLLGQMREAGRAVPPNTVAEVLSTAESIRPAVSLLDQIANVRRFFEQTAAALRSMTQV